MMMPGAIPRSLLSICRIRLPILSKRSKSAAGKSGRATVWKMPCTIWTRAARRLSARWLDEDNKATLHELAERYGISAERVRQLEQNAMKKLRIAVEA